MGFRDWPSWVKVLVVLLGLYFLYYVMILTGMLRFVYNIYASIILMVLVVAWYFWALHRGSVNWKGGIKWGLIGTIAFLALTGAGAFSEGNLIGAIVLIPIFPVYLFIIPLADLLEEGTISRILFSVILSLLVFVGYFILGSLLSKRKDKSVEKLNKKAKRK